MTIGNDLSALAPILYSVAGEVSREAHGALDGVTKNFNDKKVAKGDVVRVPISPIRTTSEFTPGAYAPLGSDSTASAVDVEIYKIAEASFVLSSEQIQSLENGGNYEEWVRQQSAECVRALLNEAEAYTVLKIKQGSCRAIGTASTNAFTSDLTALNLARTELRKNGCQLTDAQAVLSFDSYYNIGNRDLVYSALVAGSDAERRSGKWGRQYGFNLAESAGIIAHTAGDATACTTSGTNAQYATTLTIANGSSGTILAGDTYTIADSADASTKYVINSGGTATGAASGNVVIGRPGLLATRTTGKAMTHGAGYTASAYCFDRPAVVAVLRAPRMENNGNQKSILFNDAESGIAFLFTDVTQWGARSFFYHLAYGSKVIRNEGVLSILG
jgi:hypothetical protein